MPFLNLPDIQRSHLDLGLGLELINAGAPTKFGKIIDMGTGTDIASSDTFSIIAAFRMVSLPPAGTGSIVFANIVNSAATASRDKFELRAITSGANMELCSFTTLSGSNILEKKVGITTNLTVPVHLIIYTYDGTTAKVSGNGAAFVAHATGYKTSINTWGTHATSGTPNNPGSGGGGIIIGGNLLAEGGFASGIIGEIDFIPDLVLSQDDAVKIWNGGKLSAWRDRQYPSVTSLFRYKMGDDAGDTSSLVKNVANPGTHDLTLYGTPSYTTVQY